MSTATITAYKAFDKDWKCRDFQFKVGKTYTHEGVIGLCRSGFHACEVPLDVWTYYPPTTSKFALVELGGVSDERKNDSKRVGNSITIKASVDIAGLVKAQIEWVRKNAKTQHATKTRKCASASGDSGHASASGDSGHASASGDSGHASASGHYGHASASGHSGHASASGNCGHASASGYSGHASASGYSGHASASGRSGHASASGHYGHASASGHYGHASASGDSGHASASGDYGHASASGDYGCSFSGFDGKAKAGANGAFAICWYDATNKRARIVSANVGENGIKADTWYRVNDGALVECDK